MRRGTLGVTVTVSQTKRLKPRRLRCRESNRPPLKLLGETDTATGIAAGREAEEELQGSHLHMSLSLRPPHPPPKVRV